MAHSAKVAPILSSLGATFVHIKARTPYVTSDNSVVARARVEDNQVPWGFQWKDYEPTVFSDKSIEGKEWADPDIMKNPSIKLNFNSVDGKINRMSYLGKYVIGEHGLPLNPIGRTGLMARGKLGRWGPNHAADPIVTRWKRDSNGKVLHSEISGKQVLQFVSICRRDTKEWAIPGGMVDAGETVNVTLRREFNEEALAGFEPKERCDLSKLIAEFFSKGILVYEGYVDDPRNTDNAWMETAAVNFHDEDGSSVGKFPLVAGDDAGAVGWTDIGSDIKLYASHKDFICAVAKKHNAHW